jgi:ADP-ribose pyrophosphatase YjhB (NUDIX family)
MFVSGRIVGVLCVLEHEGQVVFVRHTYGNRLLWQLPGGLVKHGESPSEAIIRELGEELAVVPEALQSLGCTKFQVGRRITELHLFSGKLGNQTIHTDNIEISEYRLFPVQRSPRGIGPGARAAMSRFRATTGSRMTR